MTKEKTTSLPPQEVELEKSLLDYIEKQQSKKQSIQSFIDYVPDGTFCNQENQKRWEAIIANHKQERPVNIPQKQGQWLSDLMNLKKKRDLLELVNDCQEKIIANKQSFKILKARLIAEIETI